MKKEFVPNKKTSSKILSEQLPRLKKDVQKLKGKELTPEVKEKVMEKADNILAQNFTGEKLKAMRENLAKIMAKLEAKRRKVR